jgi:AcrR family transcriptional regulator
MFSSMAENQAVRRRPGGRSARVRHAVVEATLRAVAEAGIEKVSVADVAARAEVHETTIYRRWGTRENLIGDTLLNHSEQQRPIPDTGSLRTDLAAFASELADYLGTPLGRALAQTMASSSDEDPAIARGRASFWHTRYETTSIIVRRAIARNEVPPETDPRLVVDALIGPLHVRTLLTHEPIPPDLPARLADLLLDGALQRSESKP